MGTEKFCLRWNDFESNISVAFRELRDDKDFFDVTIACEDEQLQAHKVILSACSPFFRNVLRRNPHQHPLLYLKGVKYTDLQSVLNFMYHGEVNVAQEELNSFLAVAEELRVKGLTQNQSSSGAQQNKSPETNNYQQVSKTPPPPPVSLKLPTRQPPDPTPPPPKRPRPPPPPSLPIQSSDVSQDDDIQEVVPIKSEPRENIVNTLVVREQHQQPPPEDHSLAPYHEEEEVGYEEDYGAHYEDEGQYGQESNMQHMLHTQDGKGSEMKDPEELYQFVAHNTEGKGYYCTICSKVRPKRIEVRHHVESIHFPGSFCYQCPLCLKEFRSKNALKVHTTTSHGRLS